MATVTRRLKSLIEKFYISYKRVYKRGKTNPLKKSDLICSVFGAIVSVRSRLIIDKLVAKPSKSKGKLPINDEIKPIEKEKIAFAKP